MATRFTTTQLSEGDAIGTVVDLANEEAMGVYNALAITGNRTLTAAQFMNGIARLTGTPGAGFNVTTPTAAAIVADTINAQVGSWSELVIQNVADATATVVAGSGVTLVGVTAVGANKTQLYKAIITNATSGSEAVTLVGLLYAPV